MKRRRAAASASGDSLSRSMWCFALLRWDDLGKLGVWKGWSWWLKNVDFEFVWWMCELVNLFCGDFCELGDFLGWKTGFGWCFLKTGVIHRIWAWSQVRDVSWVFRWKANPSWSRGKKSWHEKRTSGFLAFKSGSKVLLWYVFQRRGWWVNRTFVLAEPERSIRTSRQIKFGPSKLVPSELPKMVQWESHQTNWPQVWMRLLVLAGMMQIRYELFGKELEKRRDVDNWDKWWEEIEVQIVCLMFYLFWKKSGKPILGHLLNQGKTWRCHFPCGVNDDQKKLQ